MDIQEFHNYNRLVKRGLAEPLTHSCGMEYALRVKDTEPRLQCFNCGSLVTPGLNILDKIRKVNNEFYKRDI